MPNRWPVLQAPLAAADLTLEQTPSPARAPRNSLGEMSERRLNVRKTFCDTNAWRILCLLWVARKWVVYEEGESARVRRLGWRGGCRELLLRPF